MPHSSRRALPPQERRNGYPRHPVGRVRRRWPRAYDGVGEERIAERYREGFERDRRRERRRTDRRRGALDTLRYSPVRNGLIGLAVAGTAAPIAVNRFQQALRTDPEHERGSTGVVAPLGPTTDDAVSAEWQDLEQERTATVAGRESFIQQMLQKYVDYDLDRALAEGIYDMAEDADIEPEVAFGLVRAESAFSNSATSSVGAIGLTQLMPRSAAWLEPGTTRSDLRDPGTNLRIGFHYLRQLMDKYDGDLELALTAYNRGPGTVDRVLRRGGDPDNGYAGLVLRGR